MQQSETASGPVHLGEYENSWYRPGRSRLWQIAWFFLGAPLLSSHLIPSSGFRVRLLRLFGAEIGTGVVIKPGVRVKYPWLLKVGSDSWIGEDCWIDNLVPVRIGRDVCVSQAAYLCTGNHDWSDPRFGLRVQSIHLDDGAWAGARCTLLPGVTLGACAIAAAGSVVARDIPPYEIHRGNPAAFVKRRIIRPLSRELSNSALAEPPSVPTRPASGPVLVPFETAVRHAMTNQTMAAQPTIQEPVQP